jgi:hypothetical protein
MYRYARQTIILYFVGRGKGTTKWTSYSIIQYNTKLGRGRLQIRYSQYHSFTNGLALLTSKAQGKAPVCS